ncbi:hypothetical protein CK203_098473 [Vitis vinifera]|uniref:Uncharacterized protein n=1 Tax=Vitis vinifera TaxID=29760 RepID=A0A438FIM9_VITVI|nr:hypothetical protein CK203_098473 [Vitis vinifera]
MARRYFMFVMMTFGGSMVIATLLAAVRNRGSPEKRAMCALWEGPDEDDPDDNACHVSLLRCILVLKNVFKEESCFICPSWRRS